MAPNPAKSTPSQSQSPSPSPIQLPEQLFTRDLHNLHLHHTQTDNISGRAEKYHYEIWITSPHSIAFRVNTNPGINTTTSRPKPKPRPSNSHNSSSTSNSSSSNGSTARAARPSLKAAAAAPQLKFRTRPADYKCLRPGQLWRVSWQAEQMGRCYSMVVDVVAGEVLAFVGF